MSVRVSPFTTLAPMTNQELLDAVCPTIGEIGAAFYFIPETGAVGKELGLKGMEFYVLGRGGPMGDTPGEAVAAAFGYFKPTMLAGLWEAAAAKVSPRAAGKAHLECAANLGRAKFANVAGLAELVAILDAVNNAADPDGLSLYAAMRAEELASDAPGRAMQLVALLREFRGSAHLVGLRAAGLASMIAHHVKRPDMVQAFGYTEDEAPTVTDEVHAKLAQAEKITDAIVEPAYAILSDAQRTQLVDGIAALKAALKA
jgi:hypothetical protein